MPPRPFPFPLHVGIDICSTQRIRALLQKRPLVPLATARSSSLPQLHSFLARIFSFREILLFSHRFAPVLHEPAADHDPAVIARAVQYLAGRFAAKEAVIKAVKPRRILLKDVLVAGQSQPYAVVLDQSPALSQIQRLYLNQRHSFNLPLLSESVPQLPQSNELAPMDHPDLDPSLDRCDGQVAKLSISHDGDYATAVCLAVEQAVSACSAVSS